MQLFSIFSYWNSSKLLLSSLVTHLMTWPMSLVSSSPSLLWTLHRVLSPLKPLPLTSALSRITHYVMSVSPASPIPQPPDDHVAVPAGHVGQPVHPPPPVHSLAPGPTIPDNTRIINNKHTVELFKVDKKLRRNTFNMNIYCPCLNLNVV